MNRHHRTDCSIPPNGELGQTSYNSSSETGSVKLMKCLDCDCMHFKERTSIVQRGRQTNNLTRPKTRSSRFVDVTTARQLRKRFLESGDRDAAGERLHGRSVHFLGLALGIVAGRRQQVLNHFAIAFSH